MDCCGAVLLWWVQGASRLFNAKNSGNAPLALPAALASSFSEYLPSIKEASGEAEWPNASHIYDHGNNMYRLHLFPVSVTGSSSGKGRFSIIDFLIG